MELITLEKALNLTRQDIRDLYREYVNESLATLLGLLEFDKQFVRAKGTKVWDNEGNEYLDFLGGYGSLNFGHNPEEIWQAVDEVKDLPNLLQASIGQLIGAAAFNLAAITPGNLKRVFFGNSGAEAVEGALKLARIYTGRPGIVYAHNSFHGKSFGALSVTGRQKYQTPFSPLLPECYPVVYGDLDELESILKSKPIAAFIVEPIQGEGGVIVPPKGYLKGALELCHKYGALLIADEIQTGFGRTGRVFAVEHEGIVPDIMCVAKSLGGGVIPVGAYITSDAIWKKAYGSTDKATLHTSTFGGNTKAMAAVIKAMELLIKWDLAKKADELGNYFLDQLKSLQNSYPLIKDIRGKGLLIGIEFNEPKGILNKIPGLTNLAREYTGSFVAGLLMNKYRIITAYTLNNPNVIRLEPPLIVEKEELNFMVSALKEIFESHNSFLGVASANLKTVFGSLFKK
ncbi:aspartate aminotransferase family protein [Carboxydothermus pertinax]|uniref:Aspartate aminotransferase family protein n=1 Tax=Carboxydothermus pertinax TaxID=870242 RepID=A0A1L8CXU2_9THEO|nr:aspartate aminotransferase family protein [Carboxydothermus pertinax]